MIVRAYISCRTCSHAHTLRIYIGTDSFQKHTFRCGNCGEPIEVGMEVDYRSVSTRIVPLSNCVEAGFEESGTIVTLSPNIVVPDDLQGKEYAFPFLFESHRIRKESPAYAEKLEKSARHVREAYEEWLKAGWLPPGPLHDWEFAGRVWSLFLNGRHDVCEAYIEREYARYRHAEKPDLFQVIYAFCARIGRGRAREVFEALSTDEVATEYMKHYSEYSQVLCH
jgi:hypothetical protein